MDQTKRIARTRARRRRRNASTQWKTCDVCTLAMTTIHRDWQEFLSALHSESTKFLLIGAHALAFHVEARLTEDLDIFIEPTLENGARVLRVLERFGFGGRESMVSRSTKHGPPGSPSIFTASSSLPSARTRLSGTSERRAEKRTSSISPSSSRRSDGAAHRHVS